MRCFTTFLNLSALAILFDSVLSSSVTAPIAASRVAVDGPSNDSGGGNVVFQLVGYVKNSLVRTVDGTKEM